MKTFYFKKSFGLVAALAVAISSVFAIPSTINFEGNTDSQKLRVYNAEAFVAQELYESAWNALGETDCPLILLYKGRYFDAYSIPAGENQIAFFDLEPGDSLAYLKYFDLDVDLNYFSYDLQKDAEQIIAKVGEDNPLIQLFKFEQAYRTINQSAGLLPMVDENVEGPEDAEKYFLAAKEKNCYDPVDLYNMANLHNLYTKDYQKSNDLLMEYIQWEPKDPDAYYGISLNYEMLEDYPLALEYAKKAIKVCTKSTPNLDIFYNQILDVCYEMQDYKTFKKYAVAGNKAIPSLEFSIYCALAEHFNNSSQKKVISAFAKTIKLYPEAYTEVVDYALNMVGDASFGYKLLHETSNMPQNKPDQFMYHYYLAQCCLIIQEYDEALSEVAAAESLVPEILSSYVDVTEDEFYQTLNMLKELAQENMQQ